MSRPEDRRSLISNYRRMLLRATFVLGCRRVRLELDESPSAEEALALGMQESRLEYATSRLSQNGVVVLQDREVQLSRHGIEMNGEYMRAEDLEEEQRRYMLTEGSSDWRRAGERARSRERLHQPALERVQHLAREKLQYLAREKLHQLARGKLH